MSRLIPALLFTCLFMPAVSFAAEIETPSAIEAVTVYNNRAKITREAVVEIPRGSHTVIFKDLPAGILTDSLRVEGSAVAEVTFGALSHKQEVKSELVAPREQALNTQLETLTDQRRAVEAEKQALATEKDFLQNLGKNAVLRSNEEIAEIDLKSDQWAAASTVIRTQMAENLKQDLALDLKLREIDKEIQKVRTEISQLYTGQKVTWQVSVPLESAAKTELTLLLSYQVNNATWKPLYDARLDTESGALELLQYGAVAQNTGEDWDSVQLTLSTAQPSRGAGLPELQPWWVSLWNPQPMPMARGGSFMSKQTANLTAMEMEAAPPMAAMGMAADAMYEEQQEAKFVAAEIETGGFVSEYRITGPADVPSDGTETKLMIGPFETDNELEVQVKPQLGNEAYLVAKATLKGEAPVLPGQVNLFRDGAYVGQSAIPLLRPGEEQDLSFGIDDQMSVTRKVVVDERSEAGVISKDNVLERHFVTELQNLHTVPVKVGVMETIPAPQDEKITVEIIRNATTEGYKRDVDYIKGLLEWNFEMAAKEKKNVNLGWKLNWPKDSNLSGL